MSYDITIPIITSVVLIVLAIGWKIYFDACLNKVQEKQNSSSQRKAFILNKIKPVVAMSGICIMCSILLINTDEKVAETLEYVKPSKHLKGILGRNNE